MFKQDEIIWQNEVLEMARQAGFEEQFTRPQDAIVRKGISLSGELKGYKVNNAALEAFAKLVAAKAIAKDREEFDIDELCARQNKIGYKQGYRAGQTDEREACVLICENFADQDTGLDGILIAYLIRKRGEA